MAGSKLTDLPQVTTLEDGDYFYVVDASDTTESVDGTSKYIFFSNFPIGHDICKVFLTSNSNVNDTTTYTNRSVFPTTFEINNSSYTTSSTGIIVPESGLYEVTFNCFFSGTSRTNVGVRWTINGTGQSEESASDYVRAQDGHFEASTNLTTVYNLSGSDELGLQFRQHADGGTVTLQTQSHVMIKKVG